MARHAVPEQAVPVHLHAGDRHQRGDHVAARERVNGSEQIASVVIDLAPAFPEKTAALFDLLLTSPTPQVRLLLLRRLNEVTLNESLVRCVVLDESLDGPDWRVREEVAKHMACLLSATKDSPQQAKLLEIVGVRERPHGQYLHLFVDTVSKVRETCRASLAAVVTALGADFVFSNVRVRRGDHCRLSTSSPRSMQRPPITSCSSTRCTHMRSSSAWRRRTRAASRC